MSVRYPGLSPATQGRHQMPAWFALLAVGVVLLIADLAFVPVLLGEGTRDWTAYQQAADRLGSGGPLYVWALRGPSDEYYLYPPPAAEIWRWGMTPEILLVLNVTLLVVGMASLARVANGTGEAHSRGSILALVILSLCYPPIIHDLVLGNVMALYVAAVAMSLALPGWRGAIPLGVVCATVLKPAIGPYLLWLFLCRRGDFVRTLAASLAATAVFVVIMGPGRYQEYLAGLAEMGVMADSFTGNLGTVGISPAAAALGVIGAYAVTAFAARRLLIRGSAAVAIAATLFAQPTIGFNYAGLLLPATAALQAADRRLGLVAAVGGTIALLVSPLLAAAVVIGIALLLRRAPQGTRAPER